MACAVELLITQAVQGLEQARLAATFYVCNPRYCECEPLKTHRSIDSRKLLNFCPSHVIRFLLVGTTFQHLFGVNDDNR